MPLEGRKQLVYCKICNVSVTRGSWNRHLLTHNPGQFPCEICGVYKATSKPRLRTHQLIHNIGPESKNDCLFCNKKFEGPSKLERHLRVHTKERPYFCKECPKECMYDTDLKSHAKNHIPNKIPNFHCPICSRGFYERSDLKSHIARLHLRDQVDKPHKCKICSKAFFTRAELYCHLRTHTKEKAEVCKICKKGFIQKSHLRVHILTHSEDKPFQCKMCPKKFKKQAYLTYHMARIHKVGELPYKCPICKRSFLKLEVLEMHLASHSEDRPFICKICHTRLKTEIYLKHHMRIHTGDESHKRHHCEICKKKFRYASDLQRHLKVIHDRNKPFSCNICFRTFTRMNLIKPHVQKCHPFAKFE